MHKYIIIVSAALLSTTCLAKTLSITTSAPYSTGAATIKVSPSALPEYDTLQFSNGVMLSFFQQSASIPEPPPLYYGFRISANVTPPDAGFKENANYSWKKNRDSVRYYASGDTIWSAAKVFPDSLVHLDSLYDLKTTAPDIQKSGWGKWLWVRSTVKTGMSGALSTSSINGFNTIMYFKTKSATMKFQVSEVFNRIIPGSGGAFAIDSFKIRWASDSAENGRFNESTGLRSNRFGDRHSVPNERENIAYLGHSSSQVRVFTLLGKKITRSDAVSDIPILPCGKYVYLLYSNIEIIQPSGCLLSKISRR